MEILKRCIDLMERGISSVLVTVVKGDAGSPGKSGFKMLVAENGELFGTVGGGAVENLAVNEARNVLASGRNRTIDVDLKEIGMQCGGSVTLFFEVYQAVPEFVLFGGGHVGKALTPLLESMGFRVTIMDDRDSVSGFADPGKGRTVIIHSYEDIGPVREKVERSGYCFVATHGHQFDYTLMKQLWGLSAEYHYLGLIGSRTKVAAMKKKLAEEGLSEPERLYAPVGIPLGGDTAAEIAIAIAAEIIAVRYDKAVPHMRDPKRE